MEEEWRKKRKGEIENKEGGEIQGEHIEEYGRVKKICSIID